MEFTKEAVEAVVAQVIEFARNEGGYSKHAVVAGIDGTPMVFLLRADANIDNAWIEEGQVKVEAFQAGGGFRASIEKLWLDLETKAERIFRKKSEQNDILVKACRRQKGALLDLHSDQGRMAQLTHVARFGKPGEREDIVALMDGKVFCLNALHLHKNEDETFSAQLSTMSIGGNLDARSQSLKAAIASYSDYSGNQIWDVIRVDGEVDQPEDLPRLTVKKLREMLNNLSVDFEDAELGFEINGELKGIHTFSTIRFGENNEGTGIVFKSVE